jgi:hypothetical protein
LLNGFAFPKREEIRAVGNLPDGGRCYRLDIIGRSGWVARYLKEVDSAENTLRFWQEIYDGEGKLVEIHEEFPVDKGHRKV